MADDDDKPSIRRSADNHHEFVVEYREKILGRFASQDDATIACNKWIDAIRAEKDAEKEKQRQLDEYLRPYQKAMDKIKDRNDRRRQNGTGQRESDRRKKIAKDLEGFDDSTPPLKVVGQMRVHYGNGLWGIAKIIEPPDPETVLESQKKRRKAANQYLHAQRNRAKHPDAVRAAREAKKDDAARKKMRVAELKAQGRTNQQIADELGLSIRQVQRLNK